LPFFGRLSHLGTGMGDLADSILFTPGSSDSGSYALKAWVMRPDSLMDYADFQLLVHHAPVVTAPESLAVNENSPLTFAVSAIDAGGTHVSLTMRRGAPLGATFADNGDNTGSFTWTPNFSQAGVYKVQFLGANGLGGIGRATTVITVNDVNRAPIASPGGPYQEVVGVPLDFDGSGSSDPDGSTLSFDWDFGDLVHATGAKPSHTYAVAATYTVGLTVADTGEPPLSGTATVSATIVQARLANPFTVGSSDLIQLQTPNPFWCVSVEPVGGSYSNADVDQNSFRLISQGTGAVSEISGLGNKTIVGGDRNGNGVQEISVCFSKFDLRNLFSLITTSIPVTVAVEARLVTGGIIRGTLDVTVTGTQRALASSVSPNPLNPQATLTFLTTKPGFTRVKLFDLIGRLVQTIDQTYSAAGYHEVLIDGYGTSGEQLPSGVYFYRIESAEGSSTGRFVILR